MRDLEAVLVDRVVAEGRPDLELQELGADEVGIQALRALGRLRVNETSRVARGRVVGGLVLELLLEGGGELLGARVRQRLVPLGTK